MFRNKFTKLVDEFTIPYKAGFDLWRLDRQLRPCIGTTESVEAKRRSRCQLLFAGGFMLRLRAVLVDELEKCKIPLTEGAITYNGNYQRTQAFHIKYAMKPAVYIKKYCPAVEIPIKKLFEERSKKGYYGKTSLIECSKLDDELLKVYGDRFSKDYYADKLQRIEKHRNNDTAVSIEKFKDLVHAPQDDLLVTGPVILSKTSPIEYSNLNDQLLNELLNNFEKEICQKFGDDTWYSVCLYVTENVTLEKAKFCIGAKVDATEFIMAIAPKMKDEFEKKFTYEAPDRIHHGEHTYRGKLQRSKPNH